jgi:hypothetical protein
MTTATILAWIALSLSIASIVLLLRAGAKIEELRERLTALRSNCFLTDEKGHRVRYSNASQALRDRAETN